MYRPTGNQVAFSAGGATVLTLSTVSAVAQVSTNGDMSAAGLFKISAGSGAATGISFLKGASAIGTASIRNYDGPEGVGMLVMSNTDDIKNHIYLQPGGSVGIGGIPSTGSVGKLQVTGDVDITGSYRVNGTVIGATTGTITQLTAGTGVTLTPNPITTTGTIGIGQAVATTSSPTFAAITSSGGVSIGGQLSFIQANPTISASSYIGLPGGLYVSGGTLYSQVIIYARGGLANDSAASLTISGGTSNITNVTGALNATSEITAYSSDARLKENVTTISDPLGKLAQIRGVMFDWSDRAKSLGFDPKHKHDVGVIAQDIQKILPEAIRPAPFDIDEDGVSSKSGENYLTVQYEKLTALLIEAVKELKAEVDIFKARLGE